MKATTLLALLSTNLTIPSVFAAVNESTDAATDTAAVKGITWLDSGESSSFFWQEDEGLIAGASRLSIYSNSPISCEGEQDISFIEDFFNTDEEYVDNFIKSNGKPIDKLACVVDEFKLDYGDDNELTTRFILKELMSTNYLESCRDRGEDLDECSAIFPIVKEVVDIVLDSVIPILLEESSDECQYEYKKVFGEKYAPCLAADNSFDNAVIDIIIGIDFENDEWKSSIVRLFGLIVDEIGASVVLSDSLTSCNGDQNQRRLPLPLLLAPIVKLGVVAAKAKAAVAVSSKTGLAIQGALGTAAVATVVTKQIQNAQDKIKEEDYTKSPTRKPTPEPSKSPTQSPTSQPSIEPSTSQPSIEPSSSANPSLSNQPSQNPSVSAVPSLSTSPSSQPSSRPSDEPSGQPSSSKPSMGKLRTSKSGKETKSKTGKAKCSKSKAGSVSFSNIKSIKREGSTSGKAKASKSKAGSGSGSFS